MKKSLLLAVLVISGTVISAAGLPEKWDVSFYNVSEKDFLKGLTVKSPAQSIQFQSSQINLDKIASGSNSAALRGTINADKAQTVYLGVGGKVFSLTLNGKMIYDFRQYGLGYDIIDVSSKDHIVPLQLQQGTNELLINTRRTSWRFDYCYGKNRPNNWIMALEIIKNHRPVRAELAHPEIALRPDKDSIMFSFVTTCAIPAGVDYRKKGEQQWLREYDTVGDLILREKSRVHRVKINGIADWDEIEYRLVLLEPPADMDGLRRPCRSPRTYKEVFTPVKILHNPNRKDFSFLLFGDTQRSITPDCQSVAQRREILKKMRNFPEYKNADFMIHIGDIDSYIHDVEKYILADLFNDFAPLPGEKLRPWLLVRGNHDSNGMAAENWYDHFQMPDEKSYYSFQLGDVLFIVLDCGEFFSAGNLNAFNGPLLDMQKLINRQSAWLKKLRKSEKFRQAKFRVILAHGEPQIVDNQFNKNIRKIIGDILQDDSASGRIHLWLAGHVHRYWRAARNSTSLTARIGYNAPPALAVSPVNWVTCDGPKGNSAKPVFSYISVKCSSDKLQVSAIDEDGKKFDEFFIDQQGKLHELYQDKTLKSCSLSGNK